MQEKTVEEWISQGDTSSNTDQFSALECYNNALKIDPDNETAWLRKARLYHSVADYSNSLVCYKKILEINPHHTEAKEVLTSELFKSDEKAKGNLMSSTLLILIGIFCMIGSTVLGIVYIIYWTWKGFLTATIMFTIGLSLILISQKFEQ